MMCRATTSLVNNTTRLYLIIELIILGLNYIWNLENIDNRYYVIIKQRICDTFKQHCYSKTMTTSKGYLYQHVLNDFQFQSYPKITNR